MTEKRYENRLDKSNIKFNTLNPVWDNETEDGLNVFEMIDVLNELYDENEQLKQENKKLHDRIFAMRTNEALDRTLISEKDWKNPREFLKDLDLW